MSGDIGRGTAVLLAIILCITGPLLVKTEISGQSEKYMITQILDEFTARVEMKEAVTLGDYENMLSALAGIGAVFDVEIHIGKKTAQDAGNDTGKTYFVSEMHSLQNEIGTENPVEPITILQCGNHVHTPDCYMGHNHEASGCIYHVHSPACYCAGKMTKYLKSEHYDFFCTICDGTGVLTEESTCSTCGGEKGYYGTFKCNCHNGLIGTVIPCSKCGGSGVRSSGKTCSTCGGTGNIDSYKTHAYCNGTGYFTRWVQCSGCSGAGIIRDSHSCIFCDGRGQYSGTTTYYCCAVCGQGSVTSYGTVCGKKICEFTREGYECGIDENDTNRLCGRIIVDVGYRTEQVLGANASVNDIDNTILFTYLDGSMDIRSCRIEGAESVAFSKAGEYEIRLEHTGMYLEPGQNEKKYFPVKVIVESDAVPEVLGIHAVNKKDTYTAGDPLDVEVYAVYEDGELLLDPEDYWDTFDSGKPGEQTVLIGYTGFVTELTVNVERDESATDDPGDDESGSENSGNGGSGSGTQAEDDDKHPTFIPGGNGGDVDGNVGNGSGNGADIENGETINIPEEIILPGYEEMMGTEEVLNNLYQSGRIELEEGDAFSISVVVTREGFLSGFSLVGKKKKERFTSGTVMG